MSTTKQTGRAESGAFSIDVRDDGVAIVRMDVPGEPLNTLKKEFGDDFRAVLGRIENDDAIRAVVLTSGKPDSFLAGADVSMIQSVRTATEAEELSRAGQDAFTRLSRGRIPVVAAIHGACLGGGLELALACTARVCTSEPETSLGLPEVQLGLLPGAGGTQRLPRLIGIAAALDLMLTGKRLRGSKAKKLGLVDEVVPKAVLLDAAVRRALALAERSAPRRKPGDRIRSLLSKFASPTALRDLALEDNPLGRRLLFLQARKQLLAKSLGNYPAAVRILDAVETGFDRGLEAGLEAEARAFGELAVSSEAAALMSLFFATTALKKDSGVDDASVKPRAVHRVGVLGAGLMGAGVAYVSVGKADLDVRLKDRDDDGLARGMAALRSLYDRRVKRRSMTRIEADREMARVTATTDFSGFRGCDVVVEAVFEDLALKHEMIRRIEAVAGPDTIFASNTSSIPISKIAEASSRPENVLGMHYFSPVDKMPLLEIIVTPRTSPDTTATCVALGKAQGKTVIVVNDGVGFYTSRILAPYMNEAARLLSEGIAVDVIDHALMKWGFPVGPMTLLDEVGIDVAEKVGHIMIDAFGARIEPPAVMQRLIDDGRKGRKNEKGLYKYGAGHKGRRKDGRKPVDESVYAILGLTPRRDVDEPEIAQRCALLMVNEAALCLQEGILRSPRDGDVGAVFGLGFPPFRGGPFRYADSEGAAAIVARLETLASTHGFRFQPAQILLDLAKSGKKFHSD